MSYSTNPSLEKAKGKAMKLLFLENIPIQNIADRFSVSRTTIWRWKRKRLALNSHIALENQVRQKDKPIIDAVAATANEDLQQRQQGREQSREFFATMMKESVKESAEDKTVDTAESAEREVAEEARAAEAAEMTGSDETEPNGASEAEKAVDILVKKMKPEKVVAVIKRFVKAIS